MRARWSAIGDLDRRARTIFLLACMTMPLFYVLLDSYQVDFRAFYVAGAAASRHLNPYVDNRAAGEQLYDATNQMESSRWVYPPSALFAVAPFARLRYAPARILFGMISLGSLVWVLLYLSAKFKVEDAWVIAAYVSLPVMACIERGQIDLLVLFLLVLSYAGGRRVWAGIPLGLAISIKVFPVVILIWLVLERRFREAATALGVVVMVVLLSVWGYGTAGYVTFWQNLESLGPGRQQPQTTDLIHKLGGLVVDDRWLALTHGFIGSYNNPLVLFGTSGILVGLVLVAARAFWLRYKRVPFEIGFFTMVLGSQVVNTRLWTMGMVMYLPICLIAIAKTRSTLLACLLLLPLFLPSQIRLLGISPRLVLAIAIVAYVIRRSMETEGALAGTEEPA